MKKYILAAISLSTVAGFTHAQSIVTVYGMVDLGVVKKTGAYTGASVQETANKQNKLGFQGTEDLGDGLAVDFRLESRFNSDTGAMASPNIAFLGESWVDLRGKFGVVRLGRQYTTSYQFGSVRVDPFLSEGVASPVLSQLLADSRFDNAISYFSPNMNGFTLRTQYALSEVANSPNGWNASLTYDQGPFSANMAYDKSVGSDAWWYNAGAGYVIGPVKITASISSGDLLGTGLAPQGANGTGRTTGKVLAANYLIGSGSIKAATSLLKNDGVGTINEQTSIGYDHFLSKRSTLYAYLNYEHHAASVTSYQFGINHLF